LIDFANRYSFESLYNETMSSLLPILYKSPWFSTAAFDAASTEASQAIQEYLLQFIALAEKEDPHLLLKTNACKYISNHRMPLFLQRLDVPIAYKVQIVLRWVELQGSSKETLQVAHTFLQQLTLEELLVDVSSINMVRESKFWDAQEVDDFIMRRGGPAPLSSSSRHGTNSHDGSAEDREEEEGQENDRERGSAASTDVHRTSTASVIHNNNHNGKLLQQLESEQVQQAQGIYHIDSPPVSFRSQGGIKKKKKSRRKNSPMEGICCQLTITGEVVMCTVESNVADLALLESQRNRNIAAANGSSTTAAVAPRSSENSRNIN